MVKNLISGIVSGALVLGAFNFYQTYSVFNAMEQMVNQCSTDMAKNPDLVCD